MRRHHLLRLLLILLVAITSVAPARAEPALRCERFSVGELPVPTPRGNRYARDRLERINEAIKSISHSVLFLGDSLTEGWDPGLWEQNMRPRGVLNAGISGDRTDHLLWRLEHGNLAGPPAKGVVLLIGTNDLGSGRSPEAAADGIRADLDLIRERLPDAKILLLGLLPREESPNAPLRRAVAEVNRLVRDCADGQHIIYAEIGDVLLESDGLLSPVISPDRLHFSERGYARLTCRLDPLLDRVLAATQTNVMQPGAETDALLSPRAENLSCR